MKRRLISYDAFEKIQDESVSSTAQELVEAEDIVSKALNIDVQLHCYGQEDVIYETSDGNFVHANYCIDEGQLKFEQIEELVIDEETQHNKNLEVISKMLSAVFEDNKSEADKFFSDYISMPHNKKSLNESKKLRRVPIRKEVNGKPTIVGYKKARWETTPKSHETSQKTTARVRSKIKKRKAEPESARKLRKLKRSRIKLMKECNYIANGVSNYLDYLEFGPTLSEASVQLDEKGNTTTLHIPSKEVRSKNKLIQFNWDTLKADNTVMRTSAKTMSEDVNFCKAVAELKRHNAVSDNDALEEALGNIVTNWPSVLYLTQTELASVVKEALDTVGATNFDDQTCDFMAEGILRVAHNAYSDRVNKIFKLAGVNPDKLQEDENTDKYMQFKNVVDQFYPTIDENQQLEMQVFVDLYEVIREIYEVAREEDNTHLQMETSDHLEKLLPIVQLEARPSVEIAEAATEWLSMFVETNLETKPWNVSNKPHVTVSGDHPDMAVKARHSYAPASDSSGNWGDVAPASDGKNYKGGEADKMRNDAWGQFGGDNVFPSLQNPYTPKPFGDYTMKGEPGVDKANDPTGQWDSGDTWPNLQNPYVPASIDVWKMNKGKEQDLIVDK